MVLRSLLVGLLTSMFLFVALLATVDVDGIGNDGGVHRNASIPSSAT